MQILISKKKIIRHYEGLELGLKYNPELSFYYEDTMKHEEEIDKFPTCAMLYVQFNTDIWSNCFSSDKKILLVISIFVWFRNQSDL